MNTQLKHDDKTYWNSLYSNDHNLLPWNSHKVSPIIKKILKIVNISKFKVLDIGCGFGRHIDFFKNFNCEITCIDISDKVIKLIKNKNVRLICDDFLTHKFEEKYDIILDINTSFLFTNNEKDKIISKIYNLLNFEKFYINESGYKQQSYDHIIPPKINIQIIKKMMKNFDIISIEKNIITENENFNPYYVIDTIAKKK